MDKSYNILFVSSEVLPFSKESGVGDVSFSLPLAIRDAGHDVRVMMPKYGYISERKNRIHDINRLKNMEIPVGDKVELATVKSSSIHNPRVKVQAYITTNDKYFNQIKGVYHDPKTWEEYPNNAERFIFFSRSVIETCNILGWFPDIIHCNDWQTALIPAIAKILYPVKYKDTKIVLSVHNFLNQGCCDDDIFHLTGLPEEEKENFMHNGKFNLLKAGLHYADYITTVSKNYAEDVLKDDSFSAGLSNIIKDGNKNFKGILNGIDHYNWNPKKDSFINTKFSGDIEEFKYNNKIELINKYDFDYHPKRPILIMIPRIGDQKGVPLLIDIADELFSKDIQMVLLGQGDNDLKDELQKIADKYPEKFKVDFSFDNELAHKLEAGADIFLMPSKYEPCGLNLMYSMNYGTVPVVRLTGGTNEIAVQYDKESNEGDSFTFQDYTKEAFLNAIEEALTAFADKELWYKIIENGMKKDFNWDKNAEEYIDIYNELLQ
jgi:starch synthase